MTDTIVERFLSGRKCWRLGGILAVLLLSIGVLQPVNAQIEVPAAEDQAGTDLELPDPLTPEAVREMVSRLSDADVRALLLQRLDAVARAENMQDQDAGASVESFVEHATFGVYDSIAQAVIRIPTLWDSQVRSFRNFYEQRGAEGIGKLFGILAFAIVCGLVAEFVVNRLTRNMHARALDNSEPQSLRETLKYMFQRLCHEIYGLIAFFIVARIIGRSFIPEEMIPFGTVIMVNMVVVPRIGIAIARFLLAPNRPTMRLLNTDDWTAKYLYRHQAGIFILMGFSIAIVSFNDLNGVAMGESRLGFWLNLAVHIYIIWISIRARDGLVTMMRGFDKDLTAIEERVARAYPWFCVAVSVGTWILVNIIASYGMFELLQGAPHYIMMFMLVMAPSLDTLIRSLVRHLTPPMTGEGEVAAEAYASTKRSYIRIGRVIVFGLVVLTIAKVWGIDLSNLAAAGVGEKVAGRAIEILMILAIGYLIWELVSLWINRKLAAEKSALGFDPSEEEIGGEGGGAGGTRLSTVLPLVLGVIKVAIAVIFILIALGNIGIDITPLLAGAGIVGLAIGFGAQKLVTDVVSGIFFLVDDAFRTGEYVEVEGTVGTVEKISIRSMQLRHHKGPVHTIPYGEIPKITNYSRDWVIMKLKFTVPFDTDPNKVKKLFKTIGKEMMEVPEFAADMLQPFKSQGVFDFDDVGMIIRGKFMAKPGKQFTLRKEVYNRVKAAFEANDIAFARREVRVAIPGLHAESDLSEDQKAAIAAAATEAAQSSMEPVQSKT